MVIVVDAPAQQNKKHCILFIRRWPNVFDVGPILYEWSCLLGGQPARTLQV